LPSLGSDIDLYLEACSGTVLKKLCPKEEECFQILMQDLLRPYVPVYKGQVTSEDGERESGTIITSVFHFYITLVLLLEDYYFYVYIIYNDNSFNYFLKVYI